MIKAIFFDIDGTLVSFQTHQIPVSTQKALHKLRQQGIKVFVATGRSASQLSFLRECFDFEFDGYITMNGQYCYNHNEIIHEEAISASDLEGFLPYLEKNESLGCSFLELNYVYFNRITPQILKLWDKLGSTAPELVVDNAERALTNRIYQLSAYITEDEEEDFFRHLPNCKAARWYPTFTDVIPKNGGKTVGIQKMLDFYGLAVEESMAFGDGGNDKKMLQYAHIGVAMGNATDDVKQAADYITKDIDDDGILYALQHFQIL
jgi:Cof subfamily protein (haloacid dehalogenase superfamily)